MYGIQSQERRYHYSGIAVPVCWNSSAIPAGIFMVTNFKDIIFILAMFDAEKNRCDVERAEKDNLMAPDEFGDYKF